MSRTIAPRAPSPWFWNFMAKRYARSPIADEAAYQEKLRITQTYLAPDMEVLEFGCGTGSTALVHAPHVAHIQAIDYSEGMLDIARSKAAAAQIDNVTFEQAAIDTYRAEEGRFDVVLGLSILHLLKDRHSVLRKVRKMLKPGGVFVSSTACIGEMSGLIRHLLPIGSAIGVLPVLRIFTEAELIDDLAAAGFEIEQRWRPDGAMAVFIVARNPG